MHFLTSHIMALALFAVGCGAQTPGDVVSRVDAGTPPAVDDAGEANPGQHVVTACPRQKSATPLLVKQHGLHPIITRGAQTADELITAVSTALGSSYRIVGLSRCGVVRNITPVRASSPGMTLALQGDTVFIGDTLGVSAVPVTGGVPQVIAPKAGILAADEAYVYVSNHDGVTRAPRNGGPSEVISSQGGHDIVVDDTSVYVRDATFRLLRITKSDVTQVTVLAGPPSAPRYWDIGWLAQDPTRVFFVQDERVCSVAKSGGTAVCTAPFFGGAGPLVWNGALYFPAAGGLDRTADIATGWTPLTAKASGVNLWVDDESVWWLSGQGDLHRIDK